MPHIDNKKTKKDGEMKTVAINKQDLVQKIEVVFEQDGIWLYSIIPATKLSNVKLGWEEAGRRVLDILGGSYDWVDPENVLN